MEPPRGKVRVRCECGRVLTTDRELGTVPNRSRPGVFFRDATPPAPPGEPWRPWLRVTFGHTPSADPRGCRASYTLRWERLQEEVDAARVAGRDLTL
jgi:hypothetical protein